jgi:type VI secretion system protein ImpI
MPLLVNVEDAETQKRTRHAFIRSPIRIGRSEINDLQLDRKYVSTWHGVVQFDGERVSYVDLGSTNGTLLAGARLEKNVPVELPSGAELCIGALRLQFTREGGGEAAAAPRRATQFMRAVAARTDARRPVGAAADPGSPAVAAPAPAAPADPAGAEAAPAVPPSGPGEERVRRAIEDASWQLQVLHEAWLEAGRVFDDAAAAVVERVPETDRARCRALLAERYEAARRSGGVTPGSPGGALRPELPAPPPPARAEAAAPAAAPADDQLALLRDFAGAYLPANARLEGAAQAQAFLEAVSEVLETGARGYIELRRGYDEFGKEMGLRVAHGEGPVARARDTRQLLAWLLARSDEPRAQELSGAYADLMIHQVALLNAVTEGGKALVASLSPEVITEALEREGGAGRLSLGVKALREGAQWRAFVARYRELTEDEGSLTDALFGKDFARAYSAVVGRRADPSREGEGPSEDDTPRPGPAARRR